MRGLAGSAMGESGKRSAFWARIPGAIRAMRRTAPPGSRFRSILTLSFYDVTVDNRHYRSEPGREIAIFHQLRPYLIRKKCGQARSQARVPTHALWRSRMHLYPKTLLTAAILLVAPVQSLKNGTVPLIPT